MFSLDASIFSLFPALISPSHNISFRARLFPKSVIFFILPPFRRRLFREFTVWKVHPKEQKKNLLRFQPLLSCRGDGEECMTPRKKNSQCSKKKRKYALLQMPLGKGGKGRNTMFAFQIILLFPLPLSHARMGKQRREKI